MNDSLSSKHIIAWYKGDTLDWQTFEYHVSQTRLLLCSNKNDKNNSITKIINLCEDRYHFLVTFTASILERRTTIMPLNKSEGELARLKSSNKEVLLIDDANIENICQTHMKSLSDNFSWNIDLIPQNMIVAVLYTSGSTGTPTAHPKSWRQLLDGAQQVYTRFKFNQKSQISIIATVPPQHMFGFEMSIMLPLIYRAYIHHGQPFYPLDIQQALNEAPSPRILITTPTHLKTCIALDVDWNDIDKVISATSPLSKEDAYHVEDMMNTKAYEIYGCSEIGAIATRRLTRNPDWKLLPDYTLNIIDNKTTIKIPATSNPLPLPDRLETISDSKFKLVGRIADMVKIGGKRGSLAELTAHMKSLGGIADAIVFKHEHKDGHRERLAALVIARDITDKQLRKILATKIDRVFMPRPICFVETLPYTSTGKLPKAELIACLNKYLYMDKTC